MSGYVGIANFFNRFAAGIKIIYLSTHRLRVLYDPLNPPTIMINGCMLQATAAVDLPAGLITGGAATWYIFAVRSPGSSTFTLAVNTSAIESANYRLIGQLEWSGSVILSITNYTDGASGMPAPEYDSGWFAVAPASSYSKGHSLYMNPRHVLIYHSLDASGGTELVQVTAVLSAANVIKNVVGTTSTLVIADAGITPGLAGTCYSTRRESSSGYWRIFAWR